MSVTAKMILDDSTSLVNFINDIIRLYNGEQRIATESSKRELIREFSDRLSLLLAANDIAMMESETDFI